MAVSGVGAVSDHSAGHNRQLSRQPGQRRYLLQLRRVSADGGRLSGRELPDLGDHPKPGGQFHSCRGGLLVSDSGRLPARDRVPFQADKPTLDRGRRRFPERHHAFRGLSKRGSGFARSDLLFVPDRLFAFHDRRGPSGAPGGLTDQRRSDEEETI